MFGKKNNNNKVILKIAYALHARDKKPKGNNRKFCTTSRKYMLKGIINWKRMQKKPFKGTELASHEIYFDRKKLANAFIELQNFKLQFETILIEESVQILQQRSIFKEFDVNIILIFLTWLRVSWWEIHSKASKWHQLCFATVSNIGDARSKILLG